MARIGKYATVKNSTKAARYFSKLLDQYNYIIVGSQFHITKFKLEYLYSHFVRLRIKFVGTQRFEVVLGNYPRL